MKRLAGCLIACALAGGTAWVGCTDDLSSTSQAAIGSDGSGSDGGIIVDTIAGSDGSGEGGIPDAGSGSGSDAGSGSGSGSDAGAGSGSDDGGDPVDDAGGRGDALRGGELEPNDRTSFYACSGGPAPAGVEVGLPIGLALVFAVRRRRRWRRG